MQFKKTIRFFLFCTTFLIFLGFTTKEVFAGKSDTPTNDLKFNNGDRVVILGGTLAERMQHDAWMETLIQNRAAGKKLSFRNLGFPQIV